MSNPSGLPQLFISLDDSLPEVIALESDSFTAESQSELAGLFQQSSVDSENFTSATPGPISSQVAGSGQNSVIPAGQPGGPGGPTIPTGGQDAGNDLSTAMDLGVLTSSFDIQGSVGGADPADVYQFTLSQVGELIVQLSGLSADADLGVFDSSGNLVGVADTTGTADEGLTGSNMAAGTYYAAVIPYQGVSTSYNLSIYTGGGTGLSAGVSSSSVGIESLPVEFASLA